MTLFDEVAAARQQILSALFDGRNVSHDEALRAEALIDDLVRCVRALPPGPNPVADAQLDKIDQYMSQEAVMSRGTSPLLHDALNALVWLGNHNRKGRMQ